jgi:hypothetical protein
MPAVINALADALDVRIDEVPVTPAKVLEAMNGRLRTPVVPRFDFPDPLVVPPLEEPSI